MCSKDLGCFPIIQMMSFVMYHKQRNEKYKLETLSEREGGGCYSNGSQQTAQGLIGPS
jgi:hypothetical protein